MVGFKIMFGACLLLLLGVCAALAGAQRAGDLRRVRVLHLFRAGLSLSAVSYLLRSMEIPHQGHPAPFSVATSFLGTAFLWLGWMQHCRLRAERMGTRPAPREEAAEAVPDALLAASPVAGASPLTARTHRALLHARHEAHRRHEGCVDTDHLLLGLLHDSGSAGAHVLDVLGAGREKIHLELLGQMGPRRKLTKTKAGPPALTDRAEQVLVLAAQEARRFDRASVGTEHLLLGLVLVGKGRAATVLFAEGVTVDGIRSEIIRAKKAA